MKFLNLRYLSVILLSLAVVSVSAAMFEYQPNRLRHQADTKITTSSKDSFKLFGNLPLAFEPNEGQFTKDVKFVAHGTGGDVYLASNAIILSLANKSSITKSNSSKANLDRTTKFSHYEDSNGLRIRDTVSIALAGASKAKISTLNELPGTVSYFIGKDHKNWHANIRTYRTVKYEHIYSGIDQVFYGKGEQLEHDFLVSPGANPRLIRFEFNGQADLRIDGAGDVVLRSKYSHEIRLHKPFAYQECNGARCQVDVRYIMKSQHEIGFEIKAYDQTKQLVIDPVLTFSTYSGGSGNDAGFGVALDSGGNAYVIGSTDSPSFSTLVGDNVFVAKFNSTGTQRTYLSIIGGGKDETGFSIAVDGSGSAYLTGTTNSVDFPVANPIQANFGAGSQDAFVAKLDPSGSTLNYSTYLGGSGADKGFGIAVDTAGNAYIAGTTDSSDFSTKGASDAFVTKINSAGTQREYFAILGGSGDDAAFDVVVADDGSASVVGTTNSADFTTVNALQPNFGGSQDAFIAKLNSAGSAFVYSTYFGGSGTDSGFAISRDGSGNVYFTGSTDSPEFTNLGGQDVYVAEFNSTGSERFYLVTFGGGANDAGLGIAVDTFGNAYVTGSTESNNFTTANAFQSNLAGAQDAFVAKLNPSGSSLVYSTYLGGGSNDFGSGIAVSSVNTAYVTGLTSSTNFPISNAFQSTLGGNGDAFVARIDDAGPSSSPSPSPSSSPSPSPSPAASPIQLLLDTSGPAPNQVAALDSVLLLRDPFPVVNMANLLNKGTDRNTRLIIFATNLQLQQGESSSSVVVNLVDINNQSYDITAEDVRPVPSVDIMQIVFRLPDNLPPGTCSIKLKAHGQLSNVGTIRIRV